LAVGGNVASGAVIGEFWVSYDVLLYVPRSQGFVNTTIDKYASDAAALSAGDPNMLGSGWVEASNAINTFAPTLTSTSITFPLGSRGRFLVMLYFTRTSFLTAGSGAYNTTLVGCSVASNSGLSIGPTFVANQVNTIQMNAYDVFSDRASITFANSLAFFGAAPGQTRIVITQIPAGFSLESPMFDRGGLNRDANYEKLMDMITKKEKKQKKKLVCTEIFEVSLDVENSKLWFNTISDPDTLYFLPYEELGLILGQTNEFVDKFLLDKLCREKTARDQFSSGKDEITTLRR
jgi:hypothetical protein